MAVFPGWKKRDAGMGLPWEGICGTGIGSELLMGKALGMRPPYEFMVASMKEKRPV